MMKPKRILYIEANEDGTVGGSHQALYDLVRSLDRARFEPVVLFYQRNPYIERLRALGVDARDYEDVRRREIAAHQAGNRLTKVRTLAAAVTRRLQFLRAEAIDLIHINNSPRVGSDDWLPASRLARIPCIANVMGDARGDTGTVRRWLFRRFTHYLPISRFIRDAMITQGIDESRMDLIYLGVDIEAFEQRIMRRRDDVRASLGVGPRTLFALMVGNVREWKGQHVVLEALSRLSSEQRARIFVAFAGAESAGDREYRARLDRTVASAGLADTVVFLGGRNDVPDLLNAADLALHASVRPEPFGLVVVEAMAAGRPVMAAREGGPGEIVTPQSGWIHDPSDAATLATLLAGVLDNPSQLEAMSRGARARAESFSVAAYAAGVQAVYVRLLPA
jgi:glycosyltransferase involved in cell wall biosynthesis